LKLNRVFVSSVIDKDYNWVYYEVLLFLKSFRKVYPNNKMFIYYNGKNIKIKLLLKKYNVNIVNNIKINDNYYAIKPLLCYFISKKFKPNYITWVDIDSVFYKANKPQIEILKHPKNEYTSNNNKIIKVFSKIMHTYYSNLEDRSSAIFTLPRKNIYYYYINFIQYYEYLRKNKGILGKIYKEIDIKHIEKNIEGLAFNTSIRLLKNRNKYYSIHLEYFGNKKSTISCHDHYNIDKIKKIFIPYLLRSKEYKYYRLKENLGK
jgi:hypothetical protein